MKTLNRILAASAAALMIGGAEAKVVLPSFYADNMVLQQKANMTIKGKANPGATVKFTPSWNKKTVLTKADSQGNFAVKFSVPAASMKPYTLTFSDGDGETVLSNILTGEVWLCSGQSNMEMPVQGWGMINDNAREVAEAEKYPMIRVLQVKMSGRQPSPVDDTEFTKIWEVMSPETAKLTSAVAYMFARDLYNALHVPIGIVQSAYGGATAESWVSKDIASKFPDLNDVMAKCAAVGFNRDSIKSKYNMSEQHAPTLCYNTMLYPLHVLPVKGAIWYQGCSNANPWGIKFYTQLMDSLISSWRTLWGYNFPFYYVQLAGFMDQVTVQPDADYAGLRHCQWKSLTMPRTGMATAVDIGNQKDIHPKNKQDVAHRLAFLALNKTYGKKNIVCEAPHPVKSEISGNKMLITFNGKIHARNDSVACGFIAADSDGKFVEASAKITGPTTISVSAPSLAKIATVRYDWANYPIGNIYGPTNLPVWPFRTDDMVLKK